MKVGDTCMVQSMDRKLCPITKVSSMLALVAKLCNSHKLSHYRLEVPVHPHGLPLHLISTCQQCDSRKAPAGYGRIEDREPSTFCYTEMYNSKYSTHCMQGERSTWPAERVSRGWISLGTSQPRGPQDQPNPATKRQMKTMTATPIGGEMPSPLCALNCTASRIATTISDTII